jgi:hypothetical protein
MCSTGCFTDRQNECLRQFTRTDRKADARRNPTLTVTK